MPTRKQQPERLLSEKSGRCGSRLRSVALYLWLIVVISVRQSTVAAISGLHCRALVMVSSSIRRQPDCRIQSGRNGQRDWYCRRSHTWLSPLWLSASSSACHGLLIITVITRTKTQRDKNARELSWRTRQLLTCRCVSVMLLRSMQNTRRVSWC